MEKSKIVEEFTAVAKQVFFSDKIKLKDETGGFTLIVDPDCVCALGYYGIKPGKKYKVQVTEEMAIDFGASVS